MINIKKVFEEISMVVYLIIVVVYAYATYFIHSFYHIQVVQYKSFPEVAAVTTVGLRNHDQLTEITNNKRWITLYLMM